MKIGKLPNDVLKNIILNKIKHTREDILLRPGVGEDCCAIDFEKYVCVLSSDPVTGSVKDVGKIAVHVSCNDIASCGVEPIGLLATILAPKDITQSELEKIMIDMTECASELGVEIVGGHTEITDAVNKVVIITTACGKIIKGKLVASNNAKPGDKVIITKTAGIEGTAIIANDFKSELLKIFSEDFISKALSYIDYISVVKDGVVAAQAGVSAMHDVTEGGVLGAAWEIAEASQCGIRIYADKIPVSEETRIICKHYGIDPLKLIASGSMLITTPDAGRVISALSKENIKATVIGEITSCNNREVVYDNKVTELKQPESDHLYKVISNG